MRTALLHLARFATLSMLLMLGGKLAHAQGYIPVHGKVYNLIDLDDNGKPRLFEEVTIYIYETEAEGKAAFRRWTDAKKIADETGIFDFDPMGGFEKNLEGTGGEYDLNEVSDEGSLLFACLANGYPAELMMVKNRSEINVRMAVAISLDAARVSAGLGAKLPVTPPVEKGDTLEIKKGYKFPIEKLGRSDGRFVMQSYLIAPDGTDTLEFRRVVCMDGRDYHKTQLRRIGYRPQNDTLYVIAQDSPVLSESTDAAYIDDKIFRSPDVRKGILVKANIWFEDYNHVYHVDTFEVADTRRLYRPMQFLEYTGEPAKLDPRDPVYMKYPRLERMEGEMQLPIQFAQGRASVDPKDLESMHMLDSLRRTVYDITHTRNSVLRHFSVFGISSPEGGYATNVSLAKERVKYIEAQAKSQIPPERIGSLRTSETDARVATWEELADLMAADGHMIEAEEIRSIAAATPGNIDAQNPKIYKLPYYKTLVEAYLPKLRMVNFKWKQEISRKLTDEEILDKFYNDPDFKEGGPSEFTPYEFWVLLQRITDTDELEQVCRRAIKQDSNRKRDQRWPLPGNILAESYLRRGVVDTTVLAPFIDEVPEAGRSIARVDRPLKIGETTFRLNPSPVVANQVLMMIRGEYYTRAVELAEMIKHIPEYQLLYAVARCKAGYWDAASEEGQKYYDMVHGSSPLNSVVMDMAKAYYFDAKEGLEKLDEEAAITNYLQAQMICMEFHANTKDDSFNMLDEESQDTAIRYLVKCFRKDASYIDTARGDWFIFKELFQKAKKEYDVPGSVLTAEVEFEGGMSIDEKIESMSEAEKMDIINRGNAGEELTDEEQAIFDKLSGF